MKYQKTDRAEKIKETMKTLEKGVESILNSDAYMEFLKTLGKFHNYSFRNTILIMIQNPMASRCAGFNTWRDLGRNVKKGEKAIKIFAPCPVKVKTETETEEGEKVEEIEKILKLFKVVSVFDISQTEGDELPSLGIKNLTGEISFYDKMLYALREISPYPIEFKNQDEMMNANGYCDYDKEIIAIDENLSQEHSTKTMVHEITHALTKGMKLNKNEAEIIAESVSYAVCNTIGIDSSCFSFGYIASFSGMDRKLFYKQLETIQKMTNEILNRIECAFNVKDIENVLS